MRGESAWVHEREKDGKVYDREVVMGKLGGKMERRETEWSH